MLIHFNTKCNSIIHCYCKRLSTTHATEPGRQHRFTFKTATKVLSAQLCKCLVGSLQNALSPDVNPGARSHLTEHDQAFLFQITEIRPVCPGSDQVRVCNQNPWCVSMAFE